MLANGVVSAPRVSADGRVVIWNERVGDKLELMRYKEGDIVNLSRSPQTHDLDGDLNHDGSVIAWRRAYDDGTELVALLNGREKVLDGVPADIGEISVSDDGSTIVYDENTTGALSWNVRRYRDGKVDQITDSTSFEAFPKVSADGSRIVYTKLDGKNVLMLKDGENPPKEIVRRKVSAVTPDISADGQRLLFSDKSEGDFDLYSRDLVSGKYTTVQGEKKVFEKEGQLASETGEVVYTGYDFRQGRPALTDIYLDPGEGPAVKLTSSDEGSNWSPDFSENGKTVVWVWTDRNDINNRKIFMMER